MNKSNSIRLFVGPVNSGKKYKLISELERYSYSKNVKMCIILNTNENMNFVLNFQKTIKNL